MSKHNRFKVIKKANTSKARIGQLETNHGTIETPVFMPVGTQATVKSLTPEMLKELNSQIILANTYHLHLRPGLDIIKSFNGLHDFMNWDKPILTDSGGYQVFSLANKRKILEEGVLFQSHIDGSKHTFTPKKVIDLQLGFNSDILMPIDICSSYPTEKKQLKEELDITHKWEKEAFKYWEDKQKGQQLFAIVQGGMDKELRQESAETLSQYDFPGYAIGGLSVGEPIEKLHAMTEYTTPLLPEEKPRYLMGVGLPENIEYAINQGIDMFDCVAPTRLARHAHLFTTQGNISIKQQQYKDDKSPIDSTCHCYTCKHYSKAYIRHLFIAKEMLANTLMSIHNIHFLMNMIETIKEKIKSQNEV